MTHRIRPRSISVYDCSIGDFSDWLEIDEVLIFSAGGRGAWSAEDPISIEGSSPFNDLELACFTTGGSFDDSWCAESTADRFLCFPAWRPYPIFVDRPVSFWCLNFRLFSRSGRSSDILNLTWFIPRVGPDYRNLENSEIGEFNEIRIETKSEENPSSKKPSLVSEMWVLHKG